MNLTEEQVKEIIAKVHKDLNLTHSDKYPMFYRAHKKGEEGNDYSFAYWGGGYDYRDPEAVGDNSWGEYPEWIITIDDEKGEAIMYGYYTGHFYIALNKDGKYEVVERL